MPSTTLANPIATTSYDTLEKLLLCVEVVQHGETGQSFVQISSALKENSLLTSSPNYDPGRLSGDTLRERWRDLVREEGLVGTGGNEDGSATASSTAGMASRRGRVSMRNGMITNSSTPATPSVTVPIGEKAVRDLTRKMWDVYQKAMREQIQSDERDIAQLLDEIGNLENERAKELEDLEAEETRKREDAAKAAAEQAKAEAMAAAAAASTAAAVPSKSVSPVVKKAPLPEPKKLDEPFVEQSSAQQQQASQHTTLRMTPPSPAKASLRNILTDESSQQERSSAPSDSQSSPDSASRIGYDPIRDGGRSRDGPPAAVPETPHHQHRLPSIPATEPPFQMYEKQPASLRRLSGSGSRPPLPDFSHHLPSSSPRQPPPLTPTAPRIGTFTQPGQRGTELALSPTYSRHEHEAGFSTGHQSPLAGVNLHGAARPSSEDARTPRQAHLPAPAFSPTTPSYPQPHSSPPRNHFTQSLPSIHQLSPQRTSVQPPGYPSPMQRRSSQEFHPHHSPVSEHQPLHSPIGFNHSGNVPQSPYAHQATLPHPSQSPRTPGFPPQQNMPPPQYSPGHAPPQFYQGQYPHPQQPSPRLQPAFSPSSHQNFPPPLASPENKLPPINTPTQLPPLQFATPKPGEPGRPASPLRPRPDEISPVLAPDGEAFGVPDMSLDEKLIGRRRLAKGKTTTTKTEPTDETEERGPTTARRGSRQESVDLPDEKATPRATSSSRGRGARGASKSRGGTAASTRSRRGQSVSSVGTAEPDEMDIDAAEPTAKAESVASEPIREEDEPAKSAKKRAPKKKADREETSGAEEAAAAPKSKRGVTRRHHLEPSASTEPEIMNDAVETPRDAATPVEPATPRPSFHLDNLSASATPTSSSATQVKKFAQRANPLLNNVSAHRFANLFMKPVDERSAPGYSRIVYKPQDIKSIRACIKAGAAQNPTGTPALTPTPTADGPGASFGTTPSTPTTATAASLVAAKSAITNSAQLEKEIWRMFANAVMYNKSSSHVAQEAREMARDVGAAIDNFRNAERIGERRAAEVAKERGMPSAVALTPSALVSTPSAVASTSSASVGSGGGGGGAAGRRRGSLIKSEVMGDDDSRKGDDEEETQQDEEEAEEESAKVGEKRKKGPGRAKTAGRAMRRAKKDKEGDVDMEDKPDEDDGEEGSGSEKSAEEEDAEEAEEEVEGDASGGEGEAEAVEEETKTAKGAKGRAAATAKAKNTKTTRAAAAAAVAATAAKGRGGRKGSAQPAAEADDEEAEKTKGRGRGSGRTRATKGRG
ncbi:hypothetical protein TWF696_000413 [Orbilia brochopaga]|uniref:Bromo domain-containing protein n=1 Tax=Orbilia brochopaga TaxID=3140254 RepID=A0AAV9VB73_9PEZI